LIATGAPPVLTLPLTIYCGRSFSPDHRMLLDCYLRGDAVSFADKDRVLINRPENPHPGCSQRAILGRHGGRPLTILRVTRRAIIAALGSTAAWPVVARGQQGKLPTIGFLGVGSPSTQFSWFTAFNNRLREVGCTDGRSVAIVPRWAEGRSERFAEIAAEF